MIHVNIYVTVMV